MSMLKATVCLPLFGCKKRATLHQIHICWSIKIVDGLSWLYDCSLIITCNPSGNLHLNITSRQYSKTTFDLIEPFVFEWVAKYRGSISAEHGLGLKKREYIHHSKTPSAVALMAAMKKTIDPKGIMNPYKVLPESILR